MGVGVPANTGRNDVEGVSGSSEQNYALRASRTNPAHRGPYLFDGFRFHIVLSGGLGEITGEQLKIAPQYDVWRKMHDWWLCFAS